MKTEPRLRVTQPDAVKLSALAENLSRLTTDLGEQASLLRDKLDLAQIVPSDSIPAKVVTLNSKVMFEDVTTGRSYRVTLVLPDAVDPAAGCISVVSPMGCALLGRHVGDLIDVSIPSGETRQIRLVAIPYQPEAHAGRMAG